VPAWGGAILKWVFRAARARPGAPAQPETLCNVFPLPEPDAAASGSGRGQGEGRP